MPIGSCAITAVFDFITKFYGFAFGDPDKLRNFVELQKVILDAQDANYKKAYS